MFRDSITMTHGMGGKSETLNEKQMLIHIVIHRIKIMEKMTKAIRKESGNRLTITTRMTKRKIETLLHLTEIFPASCKAVSRCST